MKRIIAQIREHQNSLAKGDFFLWLKEESPDDYSKLKFIYAMYFYVFGFRDLLQLIEGKDDNGLQTDINTYIAEDANHFRWYLQDLKAVGFNDFTPLHLWDKRLLPSRRAIYRMIAFAMDYQDPIFHSILVMIFEATGAVFLTHTQQLMKRLGLDEKLGYFGTLHYEEELSHTVSMEGLAEIWLSRKQYSIAERMVREAFIEYEGLFQSWKNFAVTGTDDIQLYDGCSLIRYTEQEC